MSAALLHDWYVKIALTAIALSLAAIALHPYLNPPRSFAQSTAPELFIEPGVYMLRASDGTRQQLGKVVVDLRTGKIWGFPTGTDAPYPFVLATGSELPISRPFLLGKFDMTPLEK